MEIHPVHAIPVVQPMATTIENKQTTVVKSPDIEHLDVGDGESNIKPVEPRDAQALLNERILASLNETLQADGVKTVDQLVPEDYTPENVADRILSFVRSSMTLFAQNNADSAYLLDKFDQALIGIERGFAEARDILEGVGALNGEVKDNVDQTYALITEGMEKLYRELTTP